MVFSSSIFLFIFFPIVLLFYFVFFRKNRLLQNIFLFIASLVFYAWGEPLMVFLMLGTIIVNWFCAFMLDKYRQNEKISKTWLILAVIFDVSILFVFKYLTFVLQNIGLIFNTSISIINISLPIGISFFTFQAMSYVIDVYRKKGRVQKNPLYVGLYIALFPQLIAGPIVRYETISDQIFNRQESLPLFSEGTTRFILGLAKKALLANTLAIIADSAFSMSAPSVTIAWLGAIAYTLQIFFDFSGYSDMAIGLGKMFGFQFEENFNYPYVSKSISEFWRRWHISMGTWFRDYVYFPLGGSKTKKPRIILNLFIVWLLTGLWHGANWTFIVWGLFYFILIAIEKLSGFEKSRCPKWIKHIYTMLFVILGWVVFRANSLGNAINYISAMFGKYSFSDTLFLTYLKEHAVILIFSIICIFPVRKFLSEKIKNQTVKDTLKFITLIILLFLAVTYVVKGTYNPFIYFNF